MKTSRCLSLCDVCRHIFSSSHDLILGKGAEL